MTLYSNKISNSKYLLAVLPLLYVILGITVIYTLFPVYLIGPDPHYAYLMNGTNLASGFCEIGHTDHPGTPVQCFAAIIILIRHQLFGTGLTYQDVLLHPESYLSTICVIAALLLGLVTFLTGKYVYRHTGNMGLAFLFQLTPMCFGIAEQAYGLHSETLIVIAGIFFMAYLYVTFIYQNETAASKKYKHSIISGIFIAFLTACKFTCLPLIFIPLFLLDNYKKRLLLIATTVVFFFFFIIPALSQGHEMLDWLNKLITHDGQYGSGEKRIFNPSTFKSNLLKMFFHEEIVFPFLYGVLTVAFIISLARLIKKQNLDTTLIRAAAGIWIAANCLIIAVAKHYSFYYLLPFLICFPLVLSVSDKIFSVRSSVYQKIRNPFITLITIVFLIVTVPGHVKYFIKSRNLQARIKTHEFLEKYRNIPNIITTEEDQSSAYIEPSLNFGAVFSGQKMRFIYYGFLRKCYPLSYEYNFEAAKLQWWSEDILPLQVLSKSRRVLVYFRSQTGQTEQGLLNNFCTLPDNTSLGSYEKIYSDSASHENIFMIHSDSALASNILANHKTIHCDLETLSPNKSKFASSDKDYYFDRAYMANTDFHHSGTHSVKLDAKEPYCLYTPIPVSAGYLITASVWRKTPDAGRIVFSAKSADELYDANDVRVETGNDGWEKIECNCIVPPGYKHDTVSFYLYYPANKAAWFDDLTITIYPMHLPTNVAFNCDLERRSADGSMFLSADGKSQFRGGALADTKTHHSGLTSIHLSAKQPYGLDIQLPVYPGDSVNATIWRKSAGDTGCMTLVNSDIKVFSHYEATVIETEPSGWKKVALKCKIPLTYPGHSVNFYLYYFGKKQEAWFDDLSIKVHSD